MSGKIQLTRAPVPVSGQVITNTVTNPYIPACSAHRNSVNQTGVNPNNSTVLIAFNNVSTVSKVGYDNYTAFNTTDSYFQAPKAGAYNVSAKLSFLGTNVLASSYNSIVIVSTTDFASGTQVAAGTSVTAALTTAFSLTVNVDLSLASGDRVFMGLFGLGNNSINTITMLGLPSLSWMNVKFISNMTA